MNDGKRDDLWVADADGSDARLLLDCRAPVPLAGRPRLVAGRQARSSTAGPSSAPTAGGSARWRPSTSPPAGYASCSVRGSGASRPARGTRPTAARSSSRRCTRPAVARTPTSTRSPWSSRALDQPGRPVRALTDPRLFAATADWSPDGKRIVYSALAEPDGEAPDLFWIRPTGGATDADHVAGRRRRLRRRPGLAAGRQRSAVQRPARRVGEPGAADRAPRREWSRLGVRRRRPLRHASAGAACALTAQHRRPRGLHDPLREGRGVVQQPLPGLGRARRRCPPRWSRRRRSRKHAVLEHPGVHVHAAWRVTAAAGRCVTPSISIVSTSSAEVSPVATSGNRWFRPVPVTRRTTRNGVGGKHVQHRRGVAGTSGVAGRGPDVARP